MNLKVVAGIIERDPDKQILLCQRPVGKHLAGLWEFPGGKIESSETPEAALVRELEEELRLRIEIRRELGVFPHVYEWGGIDLHVFVVRALTEPQATADIQVFQWLESKHLADFSLAPADVKPLEVYLSQTRPRPT